jgi:G8 domain
MQVRRWWFVSAIAALVLVSKVQMGHTAIVTPHDSVPDFCAGPIIQSVASGRWSSPANWLPARVPTANDRVLVVAGNSVVFDVVQTSALQCVGIHGQLTFDTAVNTKLWAGEVMVYSDGALQIGTEAQPVPANVTAEVVIANKPLNIQTDPDQYGTAFLSWGKVTIYGAEKLPTFVRIAQEPRAGQTTIAVAQPVTGWNSGDRLILPDTRHLHWNEVTNGAPTAPQWEERTLRSVSSDGRTLTLSSPLQFDHLGVRDATGALTFLPHVANLTRNVLVQSEAPSGTKGHVLFTHRAAIDVRYARFLQLGRTTTAPLDNTNNHIGRYSMHLHHLMGPQMPPPSGYQFTLIGNSIDGGSASNTLKWGVAIHDSHYGLIQDNVGYNYGGGHFTFEDGSESYNVVDHNFAMRSNGTGNRLAEGTEGTGFWFRGPNNLIRNNVAANLWGDQLEAAYGFKFFMYYLGTINVPNFPGADTSIAGQYTTEDGNKLPILEFSDNEVYGAAQGLTYWWINTFDVTPYASAQETVIKNLHIWHVYNVGVYHYPAVRVTFDGLVIRGKDPSTSACCGRGWHGEDYPATDIVIRNADIQGMLTGVKISRVGLGPQTIENSYLRNVSNVDIPTLGSSNGGGWIPPRLTILRNLSFAVWPGNPLRTIIMDWDPQGGGFANTTQRDEVKIYQYQGNAADNFQTYYTVQATQNVAGGLAPCAATRPEIQGLVCPIGGGTGLAAPINLRITN